MCPEVRYEKRCNDCRRLEIGRGILLQPQGVFRIDTLMEYDVVGVMAGEDQLEGRIYIT